MLLVYSCRLQKAKLKVGEQALFLRESEKCIFLIFNRNNKENVMSVFTTKSI